MNIRPKISDKPKAISIIIKPQTKPFITPKISLLKISMSITKYDSPQQKMGEDL